MVAQISTARYLSFFSYLSPLSAPTAITTFHTHALRNQPKNPL